MADLQSGGPVPFCSVCSQLTSQFSEATDKLSIKTALLNAIVTSGDRVLFTTMLEESRQLKSECDRVLELLRSHRSEDACDRIGGPSTADGAVAD